MLSYQITNILLHVIFISAFLVFFFFFYASKIENEVVKNQSKQIVDSIVDDVKILLPPEAITTINETVLPNISAPDMKEEDEAVIKTNKELVNKVSVFMGVTILIGIIIVFLLSRFYGEKSDPKFSFSSIIIHNLIILVFVAATEFVFLQYFVKNYISIDSNYIKYSILKTLSERATSKQ